MAGEANPRASRKGAQGMASPGCRIIFSLNVPDRSSGKDENAGGIQDISPPRTGFRGRERRGGPCAMRDCTLRGVLEYLPQSTRVLCGKYDLRRRRMRLPAPQQAPAFYNSCPNSRRNSLSKLGVKTPCPMFSRSSSMLQKRPPSVSALGRMSPSKVQRWGNTSSRSRADSNT